METTNNKESETHIGTVNDESFCEAVAESGILILVDFWAPWCGPCKAMDPILEMAAKEYKGRVKFLKMNVDENKETVTKLGVRGIPTSIIFSNGIPFGRKSGSVSGSHFFEFLERYLETN